MIQPQPPREQWSRAATHHNKTQSSDKRYFPASRIEGNSTPREG